MNHSAHAGHAHGHYEKALGLTNMATIALAVVFAFLFGYALTMIPLIRSGLAFGTVIGLRSQPIRPRSQSSRSSITQSCY